MWSRSVNLADIGSVLWRTWKRCRRTRPLLASARAGSSRWGMVCGVPTGAIGVKLGAGLTNRNYVNTGTIRVLPFPHPGQGCGG
ncbi:hypothetical protein Mycsm_03740 [Mycobacterium sp. JS623]|nr:hypothetical protein Mycsm_03740 [Mycobacterium sp. JS623]